MGKKYDQFMELVASDREMAKRLSIAINEANQHIQEVIIQLAAEKGLEITKEDLNIDKEILGDDYDEQDE